MIKTIVVGALGRMGQKVMTAIDESDDFELVCAVDPNSSEKDDCLQDLDDFQGEADCLIDFSFHTSAPQVSDFIKTKKIPAVIATTGHDEAETKAIQEASEYAPVFFAGNMSVGVGLTSKLAAQVATMFPDADCEIVETHHNQKVDAPSGTALMIANDIKKARNKGEVVCGRSGMNKRNKDEIGISAVRLGNIVGQHSIIFDTGTEQIEIKHTSHDRALFADGALFAARFLINKEAKLCGMDDLLCE
jgi:4-hydroxy-tetrahydrodipicolinate reductase